jgi:hypothetical protein
MEYKLPGAGAPRPTDPQAYLSWIQSEEVRSRMRSERRYTIAVAPDGTFRVDDIVAGTYMLTFRLRAPNPERALPVPSDITITREIVVPEMPGGRSDTPLDLGTIVVSPVPGPRK